MELDMLGRPSAELKGFVDQIARDLESQDVVIQKRADIKVGFKILRHGSIKYLNVIIKSPSSQSSFLMQWNADLVKASEDARELIKLHYPYRYYVQKQQGRWYLDVQVAKFWRPASGDSLINEAGRTYDVGVFEDNLVLEKGFARSPCARSATSCFLTSASLAETAPYPGWKPFRFRLSGRIPRDTKIYVGGYQAKHVAPSQWEYWGKNQHAFYVTAVHKDRILLREKIVSSTKVPTLVAGRMNLARSR
jgi:hypothetical protein